MISKVGGTASRGTISTSLSSSLKDRSRCFTVDLSPSSWVAESAKRLTKKRAFIASPFSVSMLCLLYLCHSNNLWHNFGSVTGRSSTSPLTAKSLPLVSAFLNSSPSQPISNICNPFVNTVEGRRKTFNLYSQHMINTKGYPYRGHQAHRLFSSLRKDPNSDLNLTGNNNDNWVINLLYDSECPLCVKEVNFLKKRDVEQNIKFTDLTALTYDPSNPENGNIDFTTGMKRIHAIKRVPMEEKGKNGYEYQVMDGVEVFRQVYDVIGLGYIYTITKFPVVGPLVDKLYDIWALYRFKITGRPELEELLKERQEKLNAELKNLPEECETECKV